MEPTTENLDHILPLFFLNEREALIEEVYAVFKDVKLGRGMTWSESVVEDFCSQNNAEQDRRVAEARALDEGRSWQDWTNDPTWYPHHLLAGGFNFLDDEAVRFYLPGAMVKTVRESYSNALAYFLECGTVRKDSPIFNEPQCRCIRRFLQYMIAVESYIYGEGGETEYWRKALEEYW